MPTLSPEQLRRTVDPKQLGIATTADLQPLNGIIGQKRAVSALQFGLEIQDGGFNIYVAGPPGIGKMTAVQSFLEDLARKKQTPRDWCYVNNFTDPYQPQACCLPSGRGRELQQDMRSLLEHVRRAVPKAFEGEEYNAKREEIAKTVGRQRAQVLEHFEARAHDAGFLLQTAPFGIVLIPMTKGKPISEEEFQALSQDKREELKRNHEGLQEELKATLKQVRSLERTAQEQLQELDRQIALFVVGGSMEDLNEKFADLPEVLTYLQTVQKDLLENIEIFKPSEAQKPSPSPEAATESNVWLRELPFRKYQVNVLVDNSKQEGAPVVVELNPSYNNLFGRVEKETLFGALYTDFTMIKPGSVHRANGGYLVLPMEDVLRNLLSWEGLKRTLRTHEIEIEELGERLGFMAIKSLRPQPIPLHVKVVLVGRPLLYHLLHAYDEDFPELFKVKADFDTRMDNTGENLQAFLAFLSTFCRKEKIKHLDSGAIAKLLEYSAWLAEDQEKLSTHFGALADIMREANFWAQQEQAAYIGAAHVQKALAEKIYRANLVEERLLEMTERGVLLIATTGAKVGQVNGLSVLSLGDYHFGKPSRITASVNPGREGIVDIEREVELGGPIHSKGVLILSGYLAQQFAQDKPLTLSARLVFEQSYEGVEGDSASSAELYAMLSALAEVPLNQGIAVTGSVNQKGEVQAIGGVNQKIEGFFEVCRAQGLTGEQGVIIPRSNVANLMLREEVVQAVAEKKFTIWAVDSVSEGIAILTGMPGGERDAEGKFPEATIYARVEKRLREFGERLKEFAVTGAKAKD
ncbi:AAA family ATPase [candidate division KSB1 bacterium]|nr:AAA family ATPase [candidate division KSB1 bacterium]